MEVTKVKLTEIEPPKLAMRGEIDQEGINELASSIMEVGLINPITLRRKGKKYEIIAGFRRFQALTQLQIKETEANVIEGTESLILQMRMDENLVRQSVTEFDEAIYLEAIGKQLNLSQNELASRLGKSPSYVSERLQILTYPPDLLRLLKDGTFTFSVAREFNRIKDDKARRDLIRFAVAGGISARVAREWARKWEYESKERADAIGLLDEIEPVERAVERAILGECEICGAAVDSRKLRPVWSCPDCHHSIMNPTSD